MSIEKARIFLKAKLRKEGKKLVAKISTKEIILDNERFELLSSIDDNISLQDLVKLSRKRINRILKNIIDLEKLGVIELKLSCEDSVLRTLYEGRGSIDKICQEQPGKSNIVAYEKEWGIYPSVLDFLDKESENYKLKNFEKEIYFNLIHPFLDKIPKGSTIIDAGGGIGRFGIGLVKMGHKVHIVDTSQIALKRALAHFVSENLTNFDLHWADVNNLSMFPDDTFDAAFGIELICYCDKPDRVLEELIRVTRKNGLIIISVEGKYGGLLSDPKVSFNKLSTILQDDFLYIKNNLYVRYYTPETLRKELEKSGIKVINIFGCHYVTDGIFHRLINVNKLGDKKYLRYLLNIERFCRNDYVLKNLARAWVAVGKKK